MSATIACVAGEEIHRQWAAGRIEGERIGPRRTPFGDSGEVFRIDTEDVSYYLLPRYGRGLAKTAPWRINDRANMYALKDLGVERVLAWAPGGAITHTIAVGDMVILSDLIDRTYRRTETFFEDSPLGYLREFPVFCPQLGQAVAETFRELKLVYHATGTAAVCEGPRLETPAEIRMLATVGAGVVTHNFVPEVFLARELQLCYAAVCYVVNYAETGSRHRPFSTGDLFGGLTRVSDAERLRRPTQALPQLLGQLAQLCADTQPSCQCRQTMAGCIADEGLDDDWHKWFE